MSLELSCLKKLVNWTWTALSRSPTEGLHHFPQESFSLTEVLQFAEGKKASAIWGGRMIHRTIAFAVTACVLFCMSLSFADAQASSGKASISQPDIVLFEQAQKALSKSNFAEARALLCNLIDTHPDSDYVPRAKLSIADSWYSEGAFKQAELEYRDFITFFPNRPEVAKAQRRIDSIHKNANF